MRGWLDRIRRWGRSIHLLKLKPDREILLWHREGSGKDVIGTPVYLDGRKGMVVDGGELFIIVEWEH